MRHFVFISDRRGTPNAVLGRVGVHLAIIMMLTANVLAQEPNVESYLAKIENGEVDEVRVEMPSLVKTNPNNPGVLYLQALLTTDGAEAVRMYQYIVDTHPKSDWADDALWKAYKFYTAIGLHRTAEIKLNQLKAGYPDSKYVTGRMQESPAVIERKVETPPASQPQDPVGVERAPAGEPLEKQPAESSPKRIVAKPGDASSKEETTPVETKPQTSTTEQPSSGSFTLQVGVYSSAANANRQAQFFEYQKYPTRIVSKMKGDRELFSVLVGRFATSAEAQTKGDEIKREFNIDYFVVAQ